MLRALENGADMAAVDKAHQIIIEAQAHGTGSEQEVLLSMVTRWRRC